MDIALRFDAEAKFFDLAMEDGDLATDEGLETAVMLSLYTDRRAEEDDTLPDGTNDRRGYWADAYNDRLHGSRLWLLDREKELDNVPRRAEEYAREALEWLIEDEVASEVIAEATNVRRGVLLLRIQIRRGDQSTLERQFEYVWQNAA